MVLPSPPWLIDAEGQASWISALWYLGKWQVQDHYLQGTFSPKGNGNSCCLHYHKKDKQKTGQHIRYRSSFLWPQLLGDSEFCWAPPLSSEDPQVSNFERWVSNKTRDRSPSSIWTSPTHSEIISNSTLKVISAMWMKSKLNKRRILHLSVGVGLVHDVASPRSYLLHLKF